MNLYIGAAVKVDLRRRTMALLYANVCLYVHTVRWIKPNYVSLSVLAAILCGVSCWFLRSVTVG